jgi:hypothetical protein
MKPGELQRPVAHPSALRSKRARPATAAIERLIRERADRIAARRRLGRMLMFVGFATAICGILLSPLIVAVAGA